MEEARVVGRYYYLLLWLIVNIGMSDVNLGCFGHLFYQLMIKVRSRTDDPGISARKKAKAFECWIRMTQQKVSTPSYLFVFVLVVVVM